MPRHTCRFSQVSMLACGLLLAAPALAADTGGLPGWLTQAIDTAANEVATVAHQGTAEFYLPLHTYHMRWAYTREKIDSFQENPYGLGYGRGYFDAKGNWHGLYVMGFQDSHYKPEWLAGYGWKTYWHPTDNLKLGLGYTAGITTRSDIGHYSPVPLILPIGSIEYRTTALETAYVPGSQGNGNILFFWLKWHTD